MTTTSRIPAVLDALVSTLTAALGAAATVIDGPLIRTAPGGDYLTVGWTPDGDTTSGRQTWIGVGPSKVRGEQIDVPCYGNSISGSTAVSARRTAAFALMAAAETALRADPSLGGVLSVPGIAQIDGYSVHPDQGEKGLEVGVVFHITCSTRI